MLLKNRVSGGLPVIQCQCKVLPTNRIAQILNDASVLHFQGHFAIRAADIDYYMVSLISRKKSQEFSPLGPTKSRLAHSTGLTQQGYLFWRLCPHVRPQFGSKLGWIDLLQSIDEKKANAHLGRSFSDVFRWHKGHSKITLTRVLQKGSVCLFVSRVSFCYCLTKVFVFAVFPKIMNLPCELTF